MTTTMGSSPDWTVSYSFAALKRFLSLLLLALLMGTGAQVFFSSSLLAQQPSLAVGTATGAPGSSVNLTVSFAPGVTDVSSLQFDLTLPSGLSYVSTATGSAAATAGKSAGGSSVSGGVRVLIWGMNQNAVGSGPVAIVTLSIAGGAAPGSLAIGLTGMVLSDPVGNPVPGTGSDGSVVITAPPDTTAPTISVVTASPITSGGATITWTTNEVSDTQVDYGTTAGYGSSTALNTSLVTAHSAALSGLTGSTLYHYRVKSRDGAGNLATTGDYTFTTSAPPDTTAPVISGVSASSLNPSGATITWGTNEASDSQVEYGTTPAYGNSSALDSVLVTGHSQTLSGLTASTLYHYRVKSRDAAANLATSSDFTFTTSAAADTIPPSVPANLTASAASSSQVNLSWTASTDNVGVTGYKIYRNGTQVGTTAVTTYQDTGLSGSTTYSYTVSAYDAANNNSSPSAPATATTPTGVDTTAPTISGVTISSVTPTGATLSWSTNEASDSQVEYGTTTAYGSSTPPNSSLVTAHVQSIDGLAADTEYHCRVRSRDGAGNLALSKDYTFKTSAETSTNRTCFLGPGLCFEATLPAAGGSSHLSFGQGDLSVLYGVMTSSAVSLPVALANFGFTQNGTLVTEVGIPASAPVTSTRLFVDYEGTGTNSGVALVNTNDTPIVVNAELRNARGEFVSTTSVTVEAKGHTAQFASQLIANMPDPFLGTLTLSSASPFAAVNLRLASNGHGETLFSALPLADLNRPYPGTKLIFPQVVDGGGLPTQILLMNPSMTMTCTGWISFFDDGGNALKLDFGTGVGVQSSLNYTLGPSGMVKFSTTGLGPLRVGYAVVTPLSGMLPVGSGIFSFNGEAGLSSQAGVPNAVETTAARMYVERSTDPLPRDTGLAIVNRNGVEAPISLTLVSVEGISQSRTLTLPANGHMAQFITELFQGLPPQYQGVLTMTSPVPVAALTLRQTHNQRGEQIYSTLPVADLTQTLAGPMYIPQIVDGGGYQTQLILINTSNSVGTVQIEFFNDHGVSVGLVLH